jgi:DNA-directed RNA polymerase subunit RPC12/RpoP
VSVPLGAIVRAGLAEHCRRHPVTAAQARILKNLARCGTGELGYAEYVCADCGRVEHVPRGCGNRHCPRCQGRLARAWLERQKKDLLEVPYFHVVFTLPHALLPLCVIAPRELYALLFAAAAETLLRLGRERLGGTLGLTAILHTWGQLLNLHPHLHLIVTGGALDLGGRWHRVKSRWYLFPESVMSAIFRGKFLEGLTHLKDGGQVPPPPGGWPKLWRQLGAADRWVVYCKAPFAGPESVLGYLANYTHRVAISERRIESFDEKTGTVTFRYRDYRVKADAHATGRVKGFAQTSGSSDAAIKHETVSVDQFIGRFRQHFLPRSFTKIRHYGILANHARKKQIARAREAVARRRRRARHTIPLVPAEPWHRRCPQCGGPHLVCVALIRPDGRVIELPGLRRMTLAAARAPPAAWGAAPLRAP